MGSISVSSRAVKAAIAGCNSVEDQLNKASKKLDEQCKSAGTNWKDDKYKQACSIVDSVTKEIEAALKNLQTCRTSLQELYKVVKEAEEAKI